MATEDNFIHDTFIQKMVSSNDNIIPNHFHPTLNPELTLNPKTLKPKHPNT